MFFVFIINKLLKQVKMTQEQVLGIVRHVLTFAGGLLIMKGIIDESQLTEVIGGISGLIGTVWSIVAKKK